MIKEVAITEDSIRLDQFLKWAALTSSGGHSKILILTEQVKVNGHIETRRTKKLVPGDIIEVVDIARLKVIN